MNQKITEHKRYRCPRCDWLLGKVLSKYVTKEGNFEFLHCMNCGQDFYIEFAKLLTSDKKDTDQVILKRILVELDYIVKPSKYWTKKKRRRRKTRVSLN